MARDCRWIRLQSWYAAHVVDTCDLLVVMLQQDSGPPSEDVGIKYDPDIKYDSSDDATQDDAAVSTANSMEPGAHAAMPSMSPSRESAPPSQTPSQTMDC